MVDFLIYCFECFFIVLIRFFIFLLIMFSRKFISKDDFWSFFNIVNILVFIIFIICVIDINIVLIWNNVIFVIFFFNSFLYLVSVVWK